MKAALSQFNPNLIPVQPAITRMPRYRQKVVKWNPCALKNNAMFYQFRTSKEIPADEKVIPTGCANFLFCCDPNNPHGTVSGVYTQKHDLILQPNTTYFGLYPFTVKGLRQPKDGWASLKEKKIPLAEQFKEDGIAEAILTAPTFDARIAKILEYARKNLIDEHYYPDFVEYAQLWLCNSTGKLNIKEMCGYTGYTSRYCREKFVDTFGISLKSYSNLMRFQNVLRMMEDTAKTGKEEEKGDLMDVVFANGYFDQPHLIREFRRFTDDTPAHFERTIMSKPAG